MLDLSNISVLSRMKAIILMLLFAWIVAFQSVAWAEVATATDESEDAVVMGKVLNQQQNPPNIPNVLGPKNNGQTSVNQQGTASSDANKGNTAQAPTVQQPKVANDMADGESIRQLPTLNSPVIDQANVLSADDKQKLEQQIRNLYNQGKAQIGVVIVPTTGQESIFDFAMRIAEQWKLGSAKQDNGLLIAVAVNDHRIHIATGYGLEGVLPDILVNQIIRNQISPYFKQAQYGQGILAGVTEIERILNQDPEIAQQAAEALKEQQAQALHEQQAKEKTLSTALFILIAGIVGSFILGNRLSASVAGVTAFAAGLIYGSGLVMSLILGFGIFFLLITSVAQLIFQMFLSGGGRGGGSGGGFGGGGGYSGGGGGFGGGGASGSW